MITLTAKVEERELKKYLARLDKNRGKPFNVRAERTIRAAAQRVLQPRLKAGIKKGPGRYQGGGRSRGGNARTRARAKLLRKRSGEYIRPTWVGSSAYYWHMLEGGVQAHRLDPRESGRTVSFVGRRGSRTFTANDVKSPLASFGTDQVAVLAGFKDPHPGFTGRHVIDDIVWPSLGQAYTFIARDVFDTR